MNKSKKHIDIGYSDGLLKIHKRTDPRFIARNLYVPRRPDGETKGVKKGRR